MMMNTSIANQINRFARTNENHLIELLTAICSLPSPTGAEQAKANWILTYLHKLGASEAYIDSAGNVIWPCQITKGTKHPVYGAHIDTVFNQVTSIKPKITGNVFAAPSCGDNSANVASLLFFAEMILSLHMDLPAGAFFLFNVGEEGLGNLRGIRQFMTDHAHEVSEMVAVDCNSDSFHQSCRRFTPVSD
jgi:putative aminopeptidase FrvX